MAGSGVRNTNARWLLVATLAAGGAMSRDSASEPIGPVKRIELIPIKSCGPCSYSCQTSNETTEMTDLNFFFIAVGILDITGVLVGLTILFVKAPTRIAKEVTAVVKPIVEPMYEAQQETNRTLQKIHSQNTVILDRSPR